MYAIIPADLLTILQERSAAVSQRFATKRLAPDGSDILGAVYIEVASLAKDDPAILADPARFRAVVGDYAWWECHKLLRMSPWGDPWATVNNLEGD